MKFQTVSSAFYLVFIGVSCFWDEGTTTVHVPDPDTGPRQSFFRWLKVYSGWKYYFYWGIDWDLVAWNRRVCTVAGLSIDLVNLSTAAILNRRTVLTAANYLDPYMNRQRELRIWTLGAHGDHDTPFRYRVWRVTRLFPKSLNPEHWHGPRGLHSPRHDIAVVHSLDQMYLQTYVSTRGNYPYRSFIHYKHEPLAKHDLWISGSGYINMVHIKENYKIIHKKVSRDDVVDCSKYLPKWWGKFICMKNTYGFPAVQNGGGLHSQLWGHDYISGIGSFEIRYNEEKIVCYTDIRYYYDWIFMTASIWPGEYYEYAFPQWGVHHGYLWDSGYYNAPRIPQWQIQYDLYPLG